jgi:dephospho-CoA kinase
VKQPAQESVRPPVVGIVGGLGSGKSTVAELLARRGARVVDADRIGHAVLGRAPVRAALVAAFSGGILDQAGQVDRRRLARAAFQTPERVEKLNKIVHPPIIQDVRGRVDELTKKADVPLVVVDAALLMETGLHSDLCDMLLFVDATRRLRQERWTAGRSIGAEQFEKRERAQLPARSKKERADFVVDNTGSLRELEDQVTELWPALCGRDPESARGTGTEGRRKTFS